MSIPDAPWIREAEATGHCSARNGAWWNIYHDEDEDDEEGDDGDVYYGNETSGF